MVISGAKSPKPYALTEIGAYQSLTAQKWILSE